MAREADTGDMDKGVDAGTDVALREAVEAEHGVGAGRAGVDDGGAAADGADFVGGDDELTPADVDVRVQVDETGSNEFPGRVDDRAGGIGVKRSGRGDGGDAAVGEGDVPRAVQSLARIEHLAATHEQVV